MAKKAGADPIADPPPIVVPDPYPYELPRWLHQTGRDPLRVDTPLACETALQTGWTLRPEA